MSVIDEACTTIDRAIAEIANLRGVIADLLAADRALSDFVIMVDPARIGEAEWRRRDNALIARKVAATLAAEAAIKGAEPQTYEAPRDPAVPVRIRGVGRVAGEPRALLLALTERPTDDEIRALHDFLRDIEVGDPLTSMEERGR